MYSIMHRTLPLSIPRAGGGCFILSGKAHIITSGGIFSNLRGFLPGEGGGGWGDIILFCLSFRITPWGQSPNKITAAFSARP